MLLIVALVLARELGGWQATGFAWTPLLLAKLGAALFALRLLARPTPLLAAAAAVALVLYGAGLPSADDPGGLLVARAMLLLALGAVALAGIRAHVIGRRAYPAEL